VGILAGIALSVGGGLAAQTAPRPAVSILPARPDSAAAAPADTTAPVLLPDRVAAYYFHPTIRCMSCLWIEARSDSTIRAAFSPALREGRLEWRSINIEEPANQALARRLEIEGSTLVIAQLIGGEIVRSEHVDQAWYLVGKPRETYELVRGRVAAYLGESTPAPESK
jgi:hypothetical protein